MPEGSALEGTLPAQNVSESSAPAPLFDGNDPNAVFHVLKMITASERYSVGGDKPKVPKTYRAWGKLNPNQKFKVISCYNSLDVVWKTALLAKVGDYIDPVGICTTLALAFSLGLSVDTLYASAPAAVVHALYTVHSFYYDHSTTGQAKQHIDGKGN